MPTNLTDSLISSKQISAVLRTGVVSDWGPNTVQVTVGGTELTAAYLDWYQPPVVGDLVAIIRQDSSWLVLGRYAGSGSNLVLNPSFEDSAPGAGVPLNWSQFVVTATGLAPTTAAISVVSDIDAPQAGQAANMAPGVTPQDVVLTSSPIAVTAGQSYFLSAYVANSGFVSTAGNTPPHHVQLLACWFTSDTETFPSATQTNDYTMVERMQNVRVAPPYSFVSGAVTVPTSATPIAVMRVGLRVEFGASTSSIRWDYATARRGNES